MIFWRSHKITTVCWLGLPDLAFRSFLNVRSGQWDIGVWGRSDVSHPMAKLTNHQNLMTWTRQVHAMNHKNDNSGYIKRHVVLHLVGSILIYMVTVLKSVDSMEIERKETGILAKFGYGWGIGHCFALWQQILGDDHFWRLTPEACSRSKTFRAFSTSDTVLVGKMSDVFHQHVTQTGPVVCTFRA